MKQYCIKIDEKCAQNFQFSVPKGQHFSILVEYVKWTKNKAQASFMFWKADGTAETLDMLAASESEYLHFCAPLSGDEVLWLRLPAEFQGIESPDATVQVRAEDCGLCNDYTYMQKAVKPSLTSPVFDGGAPEFKLDNLNKLSNVMKVELGQYSRKPEFDVCDSDNAVLLSIKGYAETPIRPGGPMVASKGSSLSLSAASVYVLGKKASVKEITVDGAALSVLALEDA